MIPFDIDRMVRLVTALLWFAVALVMLPALARAQEEAAPTLISIHANASGAPARETVPLGLAKAAVVELPADVRDVLISNPEIVEAVVRTPRRIFVLGQKVGQTNAFFFDAAGRQIATLDLRVERDLNQLGDALRRHVPEAEIGVESVNDNVVLSGRVGSATESTRAVDLATRYVGDKEKVVNMLAVEARDQVMLQVRVVEIQRTVAKQLGVDLSATFGATPVVFSGSNPFSLLGRALSSDSTLQIGNRLAGDDAQGVLRALERTGLMRTLAEPNLTAVSGEAAKFLAGGEFPVPISRDRDGNVQVEFKPFGVGLGFTPVVLSEGRISLKVSTEVSELTTDGAFVSEGTTTVPGITIPALQVRRAESTIELPSGGSFVIAGLLQQSVKQNLDGFPGLKDLPILGALFRSRDFQSRETELVIIVTPYLVDPMAQQEASAPGEGFAAASDFETLFLGRLNAVYGKDRPMSVRPAQNTVGFILD